MGASQSTPSKSAEPYPKAAPIPQTASAPSPCHSGPAPNYCGPPPPYSEHNVQPVGYPQTGGMPYQRVGYPQSLPYTTTHPMYATAAYVAPPTTYVIPEAFDAGARFTPYSPMSVPPPPPGVAPNAAQMAAMSGQTVILGKKESNFLTGRGEF